MTLKKTYWSKIVGKTVESLYGSGLEDSPLKFVSIDYFFLMKTEFGMSCLCYAKGAKMGKAKWEAALSLYRVLPQFYPRK